MTIKSKLKYFFYTIHILKVLFLIQKYEKMNNNNLLIDSLKLRLKEKEEENLNLLKQLSSFLVQSNNNNKDNLEPLTIKKQEIPSPPIIQIAKPIQKKRTRKRKPFFEVSSEQKRLTKKEIANSIEKLNHEVNNLGLTIGSITFLKKETEINTNVEMNFVDNTIKERENAEKYKIFKSTIAKDLANLSDRNYHLFRATLNLPISNLHQVKLFKKELNSLFTIKSNSLGVYLEPIEKIRFVIRKFIEKKEIQQNETLILKLGGDGTVISKANLKLLNFTFTCKSLLFKFKKKLFNN